MRSPEQAIDTRPLAQATQKVPPASPELVPNASQPKQPRVASSWLPRAFHGAGALLVVEVVVL
jgi:hypothetical protein